MNALLLVDVQNDFCPGGALPVPEGDQVVPVINRIQAETGVARGTLVPGLAGKGLQDATPAKSAGPVTLRSPALRPDRPLTLSVWWRLDAPLAAETCFHLLTLRGGRGMVANFVRGKGDWCALTEPRFVFQVVYYEGIPAINGIWHGDAWVEPAVWHHAAMVFRMPPRSTSTGTARGAATTPSRAGPSP